MEAMTSNGAWKWCALSAGNSGTNRRTRYLALFCAVACVELCTSAFAQERSATPSHAIPSRAAAVLDAMPHAKRIGEVAMSPDGMEVAYITDRKLAVTKAGGEASHAIAVEGGLELRDVTWSADNKRIAFIADFPGDVPAAQIWIAGADGSALTKHAELRGYVARPRFSPDGSQLALLFIEGMPRVAG